MWHKFSTQSNGAAKQAAPLLIGKIVLRSEWQGMRVENEVTGIIDTAASRSAMPIKLALEMKLPSAGIAPDLKTFDQSITLRHYALFNSQIFIPQWGWIIMTFIGCERDNVLLGRDFLKGNLLLVNWDNGFGMRSAKQWHRPLELFFKRMRKKKM